MNTSKGTERIDDEGAVEINVETVNYRKPPGRDKDAIEEKTEVTHLIRSDDKPGTGDVVAEAAGKVAEKVSQSIGLKSDKKME